MLVYITKFLEIFNERNRNIKKEKRERHITVRSLIEQCTKNTLNYKKTFQVQFANEC